MVRCFNLLSLLPLLILLLFAGMSPSEAQGVRQVGRQLLHVVDDGVYRQYLESSLKRRNFQNPFSPSEIEFLNALRKRQIRYHPCYFNPVSCFRRK